MSDLRISDMMKMQKELWELHKDSWSPLEAKYGRNSILWLIEEVGECIVVIKKQGDDAIMNDRSVRLSFIEELSDVLMYYTDTLLRYGITEEEISQAYINKHNRNMKRDYEREYEKMRTK